MADTGSAPRYEVRVDGEDWREVASLAGAAPTDAVFAVDASGRVAFGDGQRGRRPPGGSLVTVSYSEGAGDSHAQVSVTARWPPPDRSYVLGLASTGARIVGSAGAVERFSGAKHLTYFEGQVLDAADFRDEQQYLISRRYLHNRAVHGTGVVTGLSVTVCADGSSAWAVVQPGLALDRRGREVELLAPVTAPIGGDAALYVVCEYAERETDPVPSLSPDDQAPGGGTIASRIEEGASIRLSPDPASGDGVALARLVRDGTEWRLDGAFGPSRCR